MAEVQVPKVRNLLARIAKKLQWWYILTIGLRSQPIQFTEEGVKRIGYIPQRRAPRIDEMGFSYQEYRMARGTHPRLIKL